MIETMIQENHKTKRNKKNKRRKESDLAVTAAQMKEIERLAAEMVCPTMK